MACTVTVVAALWAAPARAESRPDYEAHVVVPFVPALGGSTSVEVYLADAFATLTESMAAVPSLGVGLAVGYRAHLDLHGALSVVVRARGGWSVAEEDGAGSLLQGGLELGVSGRGYNADFLYAGASVLVGASILSWQELGPELAASHGAGATEVVGWLGGVGLETDIGMLWHLDPYLFGEVGAQMWLEYVELGASSGLQVTARWALRLDWSWRASSPEGGAIDQLYHTRPQTRDDPGGPGEAPPP